MILEILLEMFPLAVLALVAKNMADTASVRRVVRSALVMQLVITLAFMALVIAGTGLFVDMVNTPEDIRERSIEFLRIKALAIPFETLGLLFIVSIKAMKRGWLAVGIASVGVLVNFSLDSVMISEFSFSLRLGLVGSAWDYVACQDHRLPRRCVRVLFCGQGEAGGPLRQGRDEGDPADREVHRP